MKIKNLNIVNSTIETSIKKDKTKTRKIIDIDSLVGLKVKSVFYLYNSVTQFSITPEHPSYGKLRYVAGFAIEYSENVTTIFTGGGMSGEDYREMFVINSTTTEILGFWENNSR